MIGTLTTSSGRQQIRRLEGASTPIIDFVRSQLPGYVGDRYRLTGVAIPRIPMGRPGVAVPGQREGISGVVATTTATAPISTYPPIDRRDVTQNTSVIPTTGTTAVRVARDWFEYWQLKNAGIAVAEPTPESRRAGTAPASLQTSPGGPEMDLGTLATDLLRTAGTAYIQREFGPQTAMAAPAFLPDMIPDIDLGVPGPGVFTPTAPAACGGASPVYKKVCGEYKWVQPKRRRRKRLATQGDLKDLAALKGILGNGKAFEVWIATHS